MTFDKEETSDDEGGADGTTMIVGKLPDEKPKGERTAQCRCQSPVPVLEARADDVGAFSTTHSSLLHSLNRPAHSSTKGGGSAQDLHRRPAIDAGL